MSSPKQDAKRPFRIIIVGGGIAGLSAAIALRGPNRHITILEQSSFLREVGAAISLQPNASKILEQRWGVGAGTDTTEPACPRIVDRGFRIYSTAGELVKEIPLAKGRAAYGADRVVYHRRDLHALLLHAATTNPPPSAIPTGLSAYRFMVPISRLRAAAPAFTARIDPAAPYTSMVMGWDRRLVMGPCRTSPSDPNAGDYAVVALVPDELMAEKDGGASWNSEGELEALREAYRDFPEWVTGMFGLAEGAIGLWQLRDLEPLERWCRGRVVLVGDAAHAMLPTQGQGASQSLEDAEALGAVFEDVEGWVEKEEVGRRLEEMVACRYERATLIQTYSRQAARPATNGKDAKVTLTTAEFMDYNCNYNGARDFQQRQRNGTTMAMVNG
ncbi:Monooxygenase FAD-binding protein [Lasiodiplodia theobromae]|nr:Monooxygenase FAD-binding protein [Lasiodiplodia theobromae]